MDSRERYLDPQEVILSALDARQTEIWTALVCTVISYDASALTVAVQPTAMGIQQMSNGTAVNTTLPVLVDVPVCFPRGGNVTLTFPIQEGDECLVVFSSRSIDNWWYLGGTQPTTDLRKHDLSDGLAIFGPFSQKTKINGVAGSTAQLRSADGYTYVEVDAANSRVSVLAANKIIASAPTVVLTGNTAVQINSTSGVTLTAPTVTVQGNLQVNGGISLTGHMSGSGGNINIDGTVIATGNITGAGTSLHTHEHSGVQTGGGTSGPPV
jgi:phage baseplate assembly protein gpV